MSVEETGLLVKLEANMSKWEKDFNRAISQQNRSAQRMEQIAQRNAKKIGDAYAGIGARIGNSFARIPASLKGLGGAFLGAAGARSFVNLADEATKMQNALRVAGLEGEALNRVYGQLFASAQRNAAPIGSLVDLYSKLSLTQNELGVSSDDLIRFTDGIAVALKVAGTDASAASGSLLQLSQALGGGTVRAEEFNSILEGTPTIAQAVARGLKEAGGSVAELRKLVVDGKVSSAAFFRAFEVGSVELRQQAETTQSTVGQAFTRLGNSVVSVVGEFDRASGASSHFADMVGEVADGVDGFDAQAFIDQLRGIAQAFADAEDAGTSFLNGIGNSDIFAAWNEFTGTTEGGQLVNPDVKQAEAKIAGLEREISDLQAQIENNTQMGFDNTEAMARLAELRGELAAFKAEAANIPRFVSDLRTGTPVTEITTGEFYDGSGYQPPAPAVEPVSITDFPSAPSKPSGGGGGGRRGRGGGGGGREKLDDFEREARAIRERTQALQTEAAVLATVAISGEDLGDAMEYARTKAELLVAAQRAGKAITPELNASIDDLARSYSEAGSAAEEAADKMQKVKGRTEEGAKALTGMFRSILDGSKTAKEALADLLLDIAAAQFNKGLMALFQGPLSGLSNMVGMGLGFSGGGFTGAGGKFEPAGIVHRGEFVISKAATERLGVGNLERLHQSALRGYSGGGLVDAAAKTTRAVSDSHSAAAKASAPVVNITGGAITVNATGGTPEVNADLAQQIAKESERSMRDLIRAEMVRQQRPGGLMR